MGKYFGTDGFRGEAGLGLTSTDAYKVGRFIGWYYKSELSGCNERGYRPRIVIGKDTRRSSYMLEYSIVAGITASGADAYMLHVTTTPSVSYVTRLDSFDCGIMITASHNPYHDNGIKLINKYGEKMDDKTTELVEKYIDGEFEALGIDGDLPFAVRDRIGRIIDYSAGRNRYIGYLISLASNSYKDIKVGIDSANGASWMIAKSVFDALGAKTYVIGAEPDGININSDCGSTHIGALVSLVKEKHLDMGFAFDGDADRCIAVDADGNILDGDKIIYVLAGRLAKRGMLNGNTVAVTVMSNSGFVNSLRERSINADITKVGDRFVYECMQEKGYSLGGEESGHIIIKKYATTGDGILTAIMLTEEVCDTKLPLGKLAEGVYLYPKMMKNVRVKDKKAVLSDREVINAVKSAEAEIDGNGRILVRESGTEPLIRIMAECKDERLCEKYIDEIYKVISERGYEA